MKKNLFFGTVTGFALGLLLFTACEQSAGGGTNTSAITISAAADLAKIGGDPGFPLDRDYTLGSDLTLQSRTPIGAYADPFIGTFDGGNHTVTVSGEGGNLRLYRRREYPQCECRRNHH
jgi:hypothetical protein